MKKVLSLAIALAMTIGLVSAFSASATSATVLKASDAIGDPTMYVEWCASAESHMENGVKVTSADVMESTYCFVAMARADVVNTPYLVIKFDEATLASSNPNTLVRIYDGYTGGTEVINNLRIGDATTDVMCFDLREYINCGGNMPEVVSLYVMLLDIAPGSTVAFESMYFTDTIPADDNTGDDTPDFEINDDAIAVGKPWAEAATSGNYDSVTDVSVSFVTGNNSIWAWQAGTAASAVLQLDEAAVSNIESIVFANAWDAANKMSITPEVGKILIDFEALATELPTGNGWYYVEVTVKADSTAVLPAFYLTNERAPVPPSFEINEDAIAVGKPWATAATVENYDSITDVSVIFPGNNSIWAWQAGTAVSAVLQLDEAAVSNIESIVFANAWEPANKMSITPEVGKILIDFEALATELPTGNGWYYVEVTVKADSTVVLPAFYLTNERAVSDDNTGDDNTGDDNTGDDNTGDDNTGDDNTGDDNTGDDTEAPDTGDVSVALPVALALTTLLVAAVVLKKKATR